MRLFPTFALIAALAGLACSAQTTAGKELKDAPGAGGAPAAGATPGAGGPGAGGRVLRVGAAPVQVRTVTYTIDALGSIEAEQEVQVVAGVEGIVTSLSFREGDEVTPDTVLATIDPERFRVVAERARAAFEKAEAEHRQAAADLVRRETLSRETPPLISEEEVQRARQDAERLRAAAAEARAQYELARIDRERSIVRPLVPGIINSRTVDIGQHVEDSAVMATLVDTRRLNLRFRVSEQESTRLRDGATVRFTTASLPGRTFNARVFHVASGADPATRMVVCLARIERDGRTLKPGFFAEVHADVESRKDAIVVPERAVQPTERGFVAFEVRDGRAILRPVSLGLRTGDGGVEILTGLAAGAVVVTDGGDVLRDGSPVEVVAGDGGAAATR